MPSRIPHLLTAALLTLAVGATASAQQVRIDPAPPAGTRLVGLEVLVTDLATGSTTTHPLGQHVPLTVGDRVRVELAGSAVIDGSGRRVALPADFAIGGGSWRLELAPTTSGGAVVHAVQPNEVDRGRDQRPSHVTFEVRGDYEPARFTSGSVTFEIAPKAAVEAPSERWQHSERLARHLAHVLLVDSPQVEEAWIERIYQQGAAGTATLAHQLATSAMRDGRLREVPPWEVTAHLYRHLLGREGTAADLWREDTGFRSNLAMLEERGYATLVTALIESEEFRQRHGMTNLERLPRDRAVVPRPR